tara:strand:- start:1505 stop:2071 length:567 start_codon:yes stop_codon:yes gene_type:complete
MNNFSILVYNHLILYNILKELKNSFDYDLNNHCTEKKDLFKFLEKNPKAIVISKEKVDQKISSLIINKPIKVGVLIEKINVILSKTNYKIQSNFILNNYYIDINSRFLIKNDLKLKLTQKEVEVIQYLKNSVTERSPQSLQKDIWKHNVGVETHTVETHIYRLRKKISEKFNDDNFIINNKKGYILSN